MPTSIFFLPSSRHGASPSLDPVLAHVDHHILHTQELHDVARQQFHLGNADIEFHTSCHNLNKSGISVKITEQVWREISPYIGCLSVVVRNRPVGEHRGQSSGSLTWTSSLINSHSLQILLAHPGQH